MGIFNLFKKKKKEVVKDKAMEALFCFKANTLRLADVLDLMDRCETFQASSVSRVFDFEILTKERYNELKNADAGTSEELFTGGLTFMNEDQQQRVFIENLRNKEKCQLLYWTFGSMQFLESLVFKEIISHEDLIVAYCYNAKDNLQQNTYQHKIEDIQNNPGRHVIAAGAKLVSAWKSWFGKNFYTIVPKEKIKRFDRAWSIKELGKEVTCVQLYENHEDFDHDHNRQIQSSFRNWMGYKELSQ